MREQIQSGILTAMRESNGYSPLQTLSNADQDLLVEHILAALADAPTNTPVPAPVAVPAQVAFTIDPAAVVARQARQALNALVNDQNLLHPEALLDTQMFNVPDVDVTREFVFAVQQIFGCKVRARRSDDGERHYLVVGYTEQRHALMDTLASFREYAASALVDLDTSQRREFWATLGALIAQTPESVALISDNAEHYATSSSIMRDAYGVTRTLSRAEVATEGQVFDLAAATMSQRDVPFQRA